MIELKTARNGFLITTILLKPLKELSGFRFDLAYKTHRNNEFTKITSFLFL